MTATEKKSWSFGRPGVAVPQSDPAAFRLSALLVAIDTDPQAGGLSWAQTAAAMNSDTKAPGGHRLSGFTILSAGSRRTAKGDGLLQMLRWLSGAPEEFLHPAHPAERMEIALLQHTRSNRVLRFDTWKLRKLFVPPGQQRSELGLPRNDAANAVHVDASTPKHLAIGARTAFLEVMSMTPWLRRPAAASVHAGQP
ncbi:MAG: hypothetical protein KGJ62_04890 [Armatimonadetes bacterium]|nr:hypothetical protein [Armatimonadota bacterium]MDE2205397.1 hypothetical protein [Armatimonadota bacterium]